VIAKIKGTFVERPKKPRRETGVGEMSKKAKRKAAKENLAKQQQMAAAAASMMSQGIPFNQQTMQMCKFFLIFKIIIFKHSQS
jgi:hypothetical protein